MPMENKQTAPKEIWVLDAADLNRRNHIHTMVSNNKVYDTDIKYLSETHVKELLSDKDKEINDLLKIVSERNAELAEKDIQIYKLKKQLEK